MAILYKADDSDAVVYPKTPPLFSLEELQGFAGGWIEAVYLDGFCGPGARILIVNEEGRLHGLPVNVAASGLARRFIVGDALYCLFEEIEEEEREEEEEEEEE